MQKVMKMKCKEKGVYQVLQQVEDNGEGCVKEFWNCVFQEHMLHKYPFLHVLQNKLCANVESSPEGIESSDEQQKDSKMRTVYKTGYQSAVVLSVERASTKSILVEERWFTPEEFVKQGITRTDGHWERDILCHGKPLKHLVQKKILDVHPQGCRCQLCHRKKTHQEKDDDVCNICNRGQNLVNCTECSLAFHHHCHLPALQDKKPVSNWKCTFCLVKNYLDFWISMALNVALKSPVSGNLRCEYLLLHLYKDTQLMLTERNVTKLDQVKNKLQNNEYKTVKEFVQDINHIYKSSNRGNVPVEGEDKVHKNFHRNFISVFKIQ
ncbi:nuclear body protein SP140-like protein [Silurus meridionalis]|uniref:nuclear body protein SP140-like protein n=1 Tax=Silurus meridionalis TaxID=175797 RepID=UPI001EEA01D5|nr:nuclear body protein SP140-like protein [Silurus meridionalis]